MSFFDWRARLEKASLDGARFFVESSTHGVGRRTVTHEYPFSDIPFSEDLGKSADTYSITGYIIQRPPLYNYFGARDKLIKKLKGQGGGNPARMKLVHPYYGEKWVAVKGQANITETLKEGGIARFSFTLVEAGEKLSPSGVPGFELENVIGNAIDSASEYLDLGRDYIDTVNSYVNRMQSSISLITSLPSAIASEGIALTSNAASKISTLVNSNCEYAHGLAGANIGLNYAAGLAGDSWVRGTDEDCSAKPDGVSTSNTGTATKSGERTSSDINAVELSGTLAASKSIATFGDTTGDVPDVTVSSENSALDKRNQMAIVNLAKTIGVSTAATAASKATYESYEESNKAYKEVVTLIDNFIDHLGDEAGETTLSSQGVTFSNDNLYESIKQMKADFSSVMFELGSTLERTIEYTVKPDTENVLTLAYDRYEDISRSAEIVNNNPLYALHPGFIAGGQTINLLTA